MGVGVVVVVVVLLAIINQVDVAHGKQMFSHKNAPRSFK